MGRQLVVPDLGWRAVAGPLDRPGLRPGFADREEGLAALRHALAGPVSEQVSSNLRRTFAAQPLPACARMTAGEEVTRGLRCALRSASCRDRGAG